MVRASETVEGRGRLYRSRRARDRAADALRTATLQRLLPRLGLGADAPASRGRGGRGRAQCGPTRQFVCAPSVRPAPGNRRRPGTTSPTHSTTSKGRSHTRDISPATPRPPPTAEHRCAKCVAGLARRDRQGGRRAGRRGQRPGDRAAVPRPRAAGRRSGRGQDAAGPDAGRGAAAGLQARAVHPGPDARRRHRLAGLRRPHRRVRRSAPGRSSPTCCWPTRSTGPRRRRRPRCWRRWRNVRSASTASRGRCPTRSSSPRRRTRSSTRAPTSCPRRSWTGSCSS